MGTAHGVEMRGSIGGIILAGGSGSRMNYQDKPLLTLGSRRIIDFIISSAFTQVDELILNVNRHPERFLDLGLPIVIDEYASTAGPLAGVLAGITWYRRHRSDIGFLASFPGDTPWFPDTIVSLMQYKMQQDGSDVAWLCTQGQLQPLFSVWSFAVADRIAIALAQGVYSPMAFIRSQSNTLVKIDDYPLGHFDNINNPEELQRARNLARHLEQKGSGNI
jgi:molybdopterin-guanine dinucleotide biosynthesis protein A